MAADGNDPEIVFELHSRSKLRSGGADDKANIMGIVDTSDTCSSWPTFRSYLAQSIGVTEEVSVAYVNDSGEEVPIESEPDFRAALGYSKLRASRGQRIVLKIDERRKFRSDAEPTMGRYGFRYLDDEPSSKDDEIVPPAWFVKYMEQFREKLIEAVVDTVIELDDMKEKKKLKKIICGAARARCDGLAIGDAFSKEARKKHRSDEPAGKCADVDDVSDGQTRPSRAFASLKTHKHDRKIERLLDAKLGKIESRSRRSLEKKSCSKHEKHHHSAKKASISALKRSHTGTYKKIDTELVAVAEACAEGPAAKPEPVPFDAGEKPKGADENVRRKDDRSTSAAATPAMGAMALSDYSVTLYPKRGQIVTYKWQVMNTGLYGWSDETELRYTWGCSALVPLNKTVECPNLKPGECGVVEVTLQAPDAVGSFESYWCFFHEGRRFGQWLNLNCKVSSARYQFTDRSLIRVEKIEVPSTAGGAAPVKLEDEPEEPRDLEVARADRVLNYGDYLYDSDSDDISVISGTISGDSSEQDEYVVVRMPSENENVNCDKVVVDGVEVVTEEDKYPKINEADRHLETNEAGGQEKRSDRDDTGTVEAKIDGSSEGELEVTKKTEVPEIDKDVTVEAADAESKVSEPAASSKPNSARDKLSGSDTNTETDDDADVVESIVGRFNFIIDNFNTLSGESIRRFLEYARSVLAAGKIADEKKRKIVEKQAQVLRNKLDVRNGLPRPTIPLSYPGHEFSAEHGHGRSRSAAWSSAGRGYQYGFACSGPHYGPCSGAEPPRPTCPEEAFAPGPDGRFPQGPFLFSPPGFVFNFPIPPPGPVPPPPGPVPPPPTGPAPPSPPKSDGTSNGSDGRHFTFTSSGSGFESSSRPKRPSPPYDDETPGNRSSRYAYVFDESNGNPIPTAPGEATPPTANGVNIIPETLIEGAVNVASSAYNTAKNVFGMFRNAETSPTDPLNRFANSNWRHEPKPASTTPRTSPERDPEPAQPPRRSIHRCLEILKEMGFNNRALNIKLLRRYDNDLPTVISKLI